jgi:hypothetical protein
MNIKKNKKTILTPAEIKNKDRSLLVKKTDKIISSSGVVIDTSDEAFAGGIIIDFSR